MDQGGFKCLDRGCLKVLILVSLDSLLSTIRCLFLLVFRCSILVALNVQGLPEKMSKVNSFARALIFTKSGFSGVFWDEK